MELNVACSREGDAMNMAQTGTGFMPPITKRYMGHANIVMTLNYYAHATFHSAQEEMERLQAKANPTAESKPEATAESAEETKAA